MSETNEESEVMDCSELVKEVVELRQYVQENKALSALVVLYKNQISDLELELSDLKAQLMAKEFELKSVSARLMPQHHPIPVSKPLTPSDNKNSKLELEILNLKSLLLTEQEKNNQYEKKIENLQRILKSEKIKGENDQLDNIEQALLRLLKENEEFKARLTIEDHSTVHKTFNTSEVKSFSIYVETENESLAESTPRAEPSLAEINSSPSFFCSFPVDDSLDPKPPKTRCKSDYPKRTTDSRIRYVTCSLSEILNQSIANPQLAKFCPSSLRKFK